MNIELSLSLFCLVCVSLASTEYIYYFKRPSYRALTNRITKLEKKIESTLKQPVHVHLDKDGGAKATSDGTHVYVHMSLDEGAKAKQDGEYKYATCALEPNAKVAPGAPMVSGKVHLRQKPGKQLEISYSFSGFRNAGHHGLHIHEAADFHNGCNSFGGHFNPHGLTHGGPMHKTRHVGDWGNIEVPSGGSVSNTMTDPVASLFGRDSIVGRGIVLHAGTDDLGQGGDEGSLKTGNAGSRLACCVIGWAKNGEDAWEE